MNLHFQLLIFTRTSKPMEQHLRNSLSSFHNSPFNLLYIVTVLNYLVSFRCKDDDEEPQKDNREG